MRASKILSSRPESALASLAQLCLERDDSVSFHSTGPTPLFQPAQTPYMPSTPSVPPSPSLLSIRPSGAIPIRSPNSPSSSTKSIESPSVPSPKAEKACTVRNRYSVPTIPSPSASARLTGDAPIQPRHTGRLERHSGTYGPHTLVLDVTATAGCTTRSAIDVRAIYRTWPEPCYSIDRCAREGACQELLWIQQEYQRLRDG